MQTVKGFIELNSLQQLRKVVPMQDSYVILPRSRIYVSHDVQGCLPLADAGSDGGAQPPAAGAKAAGGRRIAAESFLAGGPPQRNASPSRSPLAAPQPLQMPSRNEDWPEAFQKLYSQYTEQWHRAHDAESWVSKLEEQVQSLTDELGQSRSDFKQQSAQKATVERALEHMTWYAKNGSALVEELQGTLKSTSAAAQQQIRAEAIREVAPQLPAASCTLYSFDTPTYSTGAYNVQLQSIYHIVDSDGIQGQNYGYTAAEVRAVSNRLFSQIFALWIWEVLCRQRRTSTNFNNWAAYVSALDTSFQKMWEALSTYNHGPMRPLCKAACYTYYCLMWVLGPVAAAFGGQVGIVSMTSVCLWVSIIFKGITVAIKKARRARDDQQPPVPLWRQTLEALKRIPKDFCTELKEMADAVGELLTWMGQKVAAWFSSGWAATASCFQSMWCGLKDSCSAGIRSCAAACGDSLKASWRKIRGTRNQTGRKHSAT